MMKGINSEHFEANPVNLTILYVIFGFGMLFIILAIIAMIVRPFWVNVYANVPTNVENE